MSIKHEYPFDPTNGKTLDELLAIKSSPEPEGFADFWRAHYKRVMAKKLEYTVEGELWSKKPGEKIYKVRAVNYDGVEIVIFIARPENSAGGLVLGQGYGNVATADYSEFGLTLAKACVRGLGFSQCKDIPWDVTYHVLHGIGSRETYILLGVIADQWLTASVLLDMFPDCKGNLNYTGGSMGGGMGALLLPWDNRFKAGFLGVPTFGDRIRFDYQSTGSGESCRKYVLEHPEALEVLDWFDASNSARYINIPVGVAPACFDPCVAPVGQFSVANSIPEQYKTVFIRETGHYAETPHDLEVNEAVHEWKTKAFAR